METNHTGRNHKAGSSGMYEFFVEEIKEMYWVENRLADAIEKMMHRTGSPVLQKIFSNHQSNSKKHILRLEKIFELLGHAAQEKKAGVMERILTENESRIENIEHRETQEEMVLITAAKKIIRYKISAYIGLIQLTMVLAFVKEEVILRRSLDEEKETAKLLINISGEKTGLKLKNMRRK